MKSVLHLLAGGGMGGIEVLCREYACHSKNNNIFVVVWKTGEVLQEMKSRGNRVIELNTKKNQVISTVQKLSALVTKYDVDILIVHHASPQLHLYMHLLKKKHKELLAISYAHGLAQVMYRQTEKRGRQLRKKILGWSLNHSDCIVAVSKAVKLSLIDIYGVDPNAIAVIYNGVDLNQFKPDSKNNKVRTFELIYVGRLIEGKGVQLILQALLMCRANMDVHLSIVGEGSYEARLEEMSRELGVANQVTFMGSRRDVADLLKQSQVFLHVPILEEGFGITVIEAMACGLICICSKSGAIPEIIENRKNGFLIDKKNVHQLYEYIEYVYNMSDPDFRKISNEAIKQAQLFSIERFAKELDDLIDVLKKRTLR